MISCLLCPEYGLLETRLLSRMPATSSSLLFGVVGGLVAAADVDCNVSI